METVLLSYRSFSLFSLVKIAIHRLLFLFSELLNTLERRVSTLINSARSVVGAVDQE
jgi:hypothetical protein